MSISIGLTCRQSPPSPLRLFSSETVFFTPILLLLLCVFFLSLPLCNPPSIYTRRDVAELLRMLASLHGLCLYPQPLPPSLVLANMRAGGEGASWVRCLSARLVRAAGVTSLC